ncbi:cytochrome P450 [Collybia nuda]|uniref:Cytochrome P450 n=1 Tax=Collybia nuda TaxID=64659 RepID=A0A9P5Y967_9AGAR|nr:cytochrome P450 [Collybia nuda]
MYRAAPYAAVVLPVLGLQLWLTRLESPLAIYLRYATYLAVFCRVTFPMISALYRWNFVMLKGLAGPKSPSLIYGHMANFYLNECDSLYYEWEKQYGLVYRIESSFKEPVLVLTDPKGLSYVLNNDLKFPRSEATKQVLQAAFSGGLFVNDGEEHRRQRKPINSAFTGLAVQELSDTLYDLADQIRDGWKAELQALPSRRGTFDVSRRIQVLTTDAFSRTGFAYSIADSSGPIADLLDRLRGLEDNHFTVLLQLILNKLPFLVNIPNPVTKKWRRLRIELGKIADEVWDKGITEKKFHSKLLDGIGKQDRDLAISHIVALLYAGSETTANIITETLHKLALFPKIQEKLRAELASFSEKCGGAIPYEDLMSLTSLPYFDAVVKEALRVLTSVPQLSRQAREEDVIPLEYPITMDGKSVTEIRVYPGQTIHMPTRDGVNTSPRLWGPTAKQFIPERWLDGPLPEDALNIRIPGHVLSFGDGPKICVGRFFALAEFKIFVATLVQHFEFGLSPKDGEKEIVFHLTGPTAKARVKGREDEGAQLPLSVKML